MNGEILGKRGGGLVGECKAKLACLYRGCLQVSFQGEITRVGWNGNGGGGKRRREVEVVGSWNREMRLAFIWNNTGIK